MLDARDYRFRKRHLPGGSLIRDVVAVFGDVLRDDAAAVLQNDRIGRSAKTAARTNRELTSSRKRMLQFYQAQHSDWRRTSLRACPKLLQRLRSRELPRTLARELHSSGSTSVLIARRMPSSNAYRESLPRDAKFCI